MADGEDIEIRIVTAGTEQAAKEIDRVTDATKGVTTAAGESRGMGGMLDGVPERADEAAESLTTVKKSLEELKEEAAQARAEIGGLEEDITEAAEGAADGAEKLSDNVSKIARLQRGQVLVDLAGQVGKIGAKFSETADQVESFDANLAATLRNTGSQISTVANVASTMAMGFAVGGPLGAGVAGIGALLSELVGDYIAAGQAAVEAAAKSAAAFEAATGKVAALQAARDALDFTAFVAGLDAEEEAIEKQNTALERNRTLLEAKIAAQAKLAAAKAANEMAGIDADDSLTPAEKIEKKGGVREKQARETAQAAVAKQAREVAAAEAEAKEKADAAARAAADAAEVAARVAANQAEQKELEKKEEARERANKVLPGAAADAATAQKKADWMRRIPFQTGAQDDAEAKQEQLEEIRNQAASNPKDSAKLKTLQANAAKEKAAANKAAADAKKLADDAERAALDAKNKRDIFEETSPLAGQTYQEEAKGRAAATRTAADAARKQAADKAEREQDQAAAKAKREADQEERQKGRQNREAAGLGGRAAKLIPDGVTEKFRTEVERAASGLQDGDQGGELKTLLGLVSKLADATAARGDKSSADMKQLAGKIKIVEGQIRNGRLMR